MITAGIDFGTAAIKVVLVNAVDMLWAKALPTVPDQLKLVEDLLQEGLNALSLRKRDIRGVATTGYGKRLYPFAERMIDEISANAVGAHVLSDGAAKTVINIGGQDVKVIKIAPSGQVEDFKMNDKCAAGTGRFFEMAERILNTSVQDFGRLARLSDSAVTINSTCAVFAESELVSLVSQGKRREDIIAGLHSSVARRISDLIGALDLRDDVYLDGGPAANKGLLSAMEEELTRDVGVFPEPQFTVAFGAAVILFRGKGCA